MASVRGKRVGPRYRITGVMADGEMTARSYVRSRHQEAATGLSSAKAVAVKLLDRLIAVEYVAIDVQDEDGVWTEVEKVRR